MTVRIETYPLNRVCPHIDSVVKERKSKSSNSILGMSYYKVSNFIIVTIFKKASIHNTKSKIGKNELIMASAVQESQVSLFVEEACFLL